MQIIFNQDKREAADEVAQLLTVVSRALDPIDNHNDLTLTNDEAVALSSFVEHIAKALVRLNQG